MRTNLAQRCAKFGQTIKHVEVDAAYVRVGTDPHGDERILPAVDAEKTEAGARAPTHPVHCNVKL
jgi:hypothetical protein